MPSDIQEIQYRVTMKLQIWEETTKARVDFIIDKTISFVLFLQTCLLPSESNFLSIHKQFQCYLNSSYLL